MKKYPLSLDGTPPPPTARSRWRRFTDRQLPIAVIYLMVTVLVAVVLFPHVVVTVPSGHVGVRFAPGAFNRSVQHQSQSIGRGFEAQGLSRALIEPQRN